MKGSFNLCDVRDLAFGCIAAADRGKRGECYILGNEEVTLKQLCQMLHDECGCKKIRFYLPLWIANVFAKMMEKQAAKKGEKPMMTTFSVYNLARNNTFDYSKAKREQGLQLSSVMTNIVQLIIEHLCLHVVILSDIFFVSTCFPFLMILQLDVT